jgi:23S rRNA (pseudouridine1915-N3)-methyltransferase
MQILLLAVSRRRPGWARDAAAEYLQRLPPWIKVREVDIAPARRSRTEPRAQVLRAEAAKFRSALRTGCRCVALDETGRAIDTATIADRLRRWRDAGTDVALLIGGADGLDPTLIKESQECWSLSALTLPHVLARVLLIEQLYRACSILENHPYHRE